MDLQATDQGPGASSDALKVPDLAGLSTTQAAQALQDDGHNELPDAQKRTLLSIARETLSDPMFALLLAAGILYLVLGDLQEGLVLFGLVLVVLGLTLYQEGKTERAIESLRDLTSPRALVMRDGAAQRIAGREVVRGDVLLLAEGDRIPADAVLLQGAEVQVDESLLTGEPMPVDKVVAPSDRPGEPAAPESALFSGTLLVRGQGLARVTATGRHSEIGRIGQALCSLTSETSPLKQQMARLVRLLALLALFASLFLLAAYGLMRGDWLAALLAAIALAMALLPQEFTVVLTVIPALGAWRLSRQNVLTRRIAAIETLGATSVLCADKTGTLTENRMTVSELYAPPRQAPPLPGGEVHQACATADHLSIDYATTTELNECFHALVEYSILASVTDPFDPMEKAFHHLGQHFLQDTEHLHRDWTLMQTYGLTPELRAMSHVWQARIGDAHVVAAKGAPEAIVDLCHLDSAAQQRIASAVEAMAAKGLRVLAVAGGRFEGQDWPAIEHDFDFEFIGLLGLADPLRAEIPKAVKEAHNAGIRVVMITGDYPATALAIAAQAGLQPGPQGLLTGDELTHLTDTELQQRMDSVRVCARIAPTQKLRIVQALKAAGEVVAMTGDGVNDAPALKAAHVGVAMGGRGTDVAREAASIVLLDDNFASIVGAVRLGRRIFDNLRKSMSYILAVHVPIAGMALLPVLLGWPTVLFPLHIAFLELVIDPACSMVFESEPAESDVMQRPPRDVKQSLFGGMTLGLALLQGLGALAVVLVATVWGTNHLTEGAMRALAFAVLVFTNLALIFSNRSSVVSLWASLWVPNRALWWVVAAALSLLGLVLYVPWLAGLFLFEPLPIAWLAGAAGLGIASVLWFELLKAIKSNI
jgi:Ca2+-transporting ATPase